MHATGVINLRSIVAVRRAFVLVPPTTHTEKDPGPDDNAWFNVWSQQEQPNLDDDEDLGGEVYLLQHNDRALVRMRRCFELLLNTGNVIRFEVSASPSC